MEVEWVEVKGPSVDVAVAAALEELNIENPDHAEVEVLDAGAKGTLGFGKREAVVRVKPKPRPKKRRRRNRKSGSGNQGDSQDKGRKSAQPGQRSGGGGRQSQQKPASGGRDGGKDRQNQPSKAESTPKPEEPPVDRDEQATVVREFLDGLLDAFGLEGDVSVTTEDEAVVAAVHGDQTEALVGEKAVILQSVLELTRTVVQRQTHDGVRIRLDIAGYRERRREALAIYASRLAEQVLDEKTELQLEPMNAADRKVIHDAIGEIEGVRSYSEGDDPRRFVVLGPEGDV